MWPKKKRDKVVAEITTAHVIKLMQRQGKFLDQEQAVDFLNERGRAQAMWTQMMYAGESYIESVLAQFQPRAATLKSDLLASSQVIVRATEEAYSRDSQAGNSLRGGGVS